MPTSTEEINVVKSFAKFEALKELLEDDNGESNPSQYEYKNVTKITLLSKICT